MTTRAPGKLMIAGEYAVLDGRRAIVMAVDRHAVAHLAPSPAMRAQPEVDAVLANAVARGWLAHAPHVVVDTTALGTADAKYGLGSSAAACVAALGAALAGAGHDVGAMRASIASCAREGHRRAQGGGSGVDVLASALGGVHAVTLGSHPDDPPAIARLAWHVPFAVLWTGTSVRTSVLLAGVRALRERDPRAYSHAIGTVGDAADRVYDALRATAARDVVSAVRSHGDAMQALGEASGVPIVTAAMRTLDRAVADAGCAVKPSGAGGGDVVLLVGDDEASVARGVAAGVAHGFTPLALAVDPHGVTQRD